MVVAQFEKQKMVKAKILATTGICRETLQLPAE